MGFEVGKAQELIELIRTTFSDVPRPDLTKRFGHALDDEWTLTRDRADELRALDTEQFWWEVIDEDVEEFHDILIWGDAHSFRFYYPRFLIYSIEHSDDFNSHVNISMFEFPPTRFYQFFAMHGGELQAVADVIAEFDSQDSTWDYLTLWDLIQRRIVALEKGLAHVIAEPTA